jgi:site-specific recombinase XerD
MCRPEVLSVRSTTHLLRKSFMTNLHRKGVAMEVLDAILGHSIGVNDAYLDLEEQMWAAMRLVPQYEPPKRPELAVVSKG